jgi:type IX secretion system PorP/SprF family membrane protein
VGLTIDQDQLGYDKTLKAKLAYSYHLSLGGLGTLGIGLDAGMIQKSIKGNFIAPDGTTTVGGGGTDQSIPWNGTSAVTYDVGLGLYFTNNNLYVGISSLHLPGQTLSNSGGSASTAYNFEYKMARHYFIMAGYKFNLGKDFTLTPGILAKSDAASTQMDINLFAKYRNMVFVGVSYRLTDAIPVMVGLEWPLKNAKSTVKLGYSFDVTLSALSKYENGTHEIMLGFCQKFVKPSHKQSHQNVRFL